MYQKSTETVTYVLTANTSHKQRAEEIGPDGHLIGIGEQPVNDPHAADVDARKQAGAHHGENRHRLGKAVDARPPFLAEEEQNGRNQRAGVADADPENEVRDVEGPAHRPIEVPDAHAGKEQVQDHQAQHAQQTSEIAMAIYQARGGR